MSDRSPRWKWYVCGLLLLATMLLYMDRQTLAQTRTAIERDLGINDAQYGRLEMGFGLAFAFGSIVFGCFVDLVSVRVLYPIVIVGWSLAGVATAYASNIGDMLLPLLHPIVGDPQAWALQLTHLSKSQNAWPPEHQSNLSRDFLGFLACRMLLGFFESGHWPCALVVTQRLLTRKERPLGNSVLQSGASIGAVLTPLVVLAFNIKTPGNWRYPFVVIGIMGLAWTIPWFGLIRKKDLRPLEHAEDTAKTTEFAGSEPRLLRKFLVCLVVVIMINLTWQFYRAWLPSFLEKYHGYSFETAALYMSAFYIASDVGCIAVGAAVRWLTAKRWDVHYARLLTFAICAAMTALGFVIAVLPKGPWLLILLLFVAAGSLGFFPNYYAFSQDLTRRHQGKIIGVLSCITWVASAFMQMSVGAYLEENQSYQLAITLAAAAPLIALAALLLFWRPTKSV